MRFIGKLNAAVFERSYSPENICQSVPELA
jgi:hypothetical protein